MFSVFVRIPKSAMGTLAPLKPTSLLLDEYEPGERRTLAYNVAREIHWAFKRFPEDTELVVIALPVSAKDPDMRDIFVRELDQAYERMQEDYPGPPPPIGGVGQSKE